MHYDDLTKDPNYDPAGFIDWLRVALKCRNDNAVAIALDESPATISHIRRGRKTPSAPMLIAIHEETGLHIREIKARMFRAPLKAAA